MLGLPALHGVSGFGGGTAVKADVAQLGAGLVSVGDYQRVTAEQRVAGVASHAASVNLTLINLVTRNFLMEATEVYG